MLLHLIASDIDFLGWGARFCYLGVVKNPTDRFLKFLQFSSSKQQNTEKIKDIVTGTKLVYDG